MTTDWRNLPAGAEGDRAVAEAQGWTSDGGNWWKDGNFIYEDNGYWQDNSYCDNLYEPTTDIAQAFLLLSGLPPEWGFAVYAGLAENHDFNGEVWLKEGDTCFHENAPTAALAICRAWGLWKEGQDAKEASHQPPAS